MTVSDMYTKEIDNIESCTSGSINSWSDHRVKPLNNPFQISELYFPPLYNENPSIQRQLNSILETFSRSYSERVNSNIGFYMIPNFTLSELDDESIVLELNDRELRASFIIDKNQDNSSWMIITSDELNNFSTQGSLIPNHYELVVRTILDLFVSFK